MNVLLAVLFDSGNESSLFRIHPWSCLDLQTGQGSLRPLQRRSVQTARQRAETQDPASCPAATPDRTNAPNHGPPVNVCLIREEKL